MKFATSPEFADSSPVYKSGNIVFFDLLGAVIVYWSEFVGYIVNISILLLSIYSIHWNVKKSANEGMLIIT